MAFLPDLGAAALYAVVVFLLALGFLVVFVEAIRPSRVAGSLAADVALVLLFVWLGESGLALLVLGLGAAVLANHAFEWLTTR